MIKNVQYLSSGKSNDANSSPEKQAVFICEKQRGNTWDVPSRFDEQKEV
jgi:hypothetical protein